MYLRKERDFLRKTSFLQTIERFTLFNKVRSSEIWKSVNIEPLYFSKLKDFN